MTRRCGSGSGGGSGSSGNSGRWSFSRYCGPHARGILAGLVILAACGREDAPNDPSGASAVSRSRTSPDLASSRTTPDAALSRAGAWLWAQQQPDGSWRSGTYAVLRSGQAYTPFVLATLLRVPAGTCARPEGAVDRALDFIRAQASADGSLGYRDPDVLEYPVYATSLALWCLVRAGADGTDSAAGNDAGNGADNAADTSDDEGDTALIARMSDWLARRQYDETEGFAPDDHAYGGWGFGARDLPRAHPGYMDLPHTRRALEALRAAGRADATVCERALRFLALVQRQRSAADRQPYLTDDAGSTDSDAGVPFDGGFYFSPVILGANKGRIAEAVDGAPPHLRSYATATADGVLALLAAGASTDDARVHAAVAWLEAHPALDHPDGIPGPTGDPWREALFYYHLAVRAEALAAVGTDIDGGWRTQIPARLAALQLEDGSFANDRSSLMKEDDPLLATALAVTALTHALR